MTHYFDTVRAIVLDKGTKKSKIERLQKEVGCTVYEANVYYNNLFSEFSLKRSEIEQKEGKLRFTIGVEIECFGINKDRVMDSLGRRGVSAINTGYSHEDSDTFYKLGYDGSISGENACEVVSPILKSLKSLKEVCDVINEAGAQVNRSCGLHVHFGADKFTPAQWQRIIVNYAAIEPVIDSFMPMSRRGNNNHYCRSIVEVSHRVDAFANVTMSKIQDDFCYGRYFKVNVMAYDRHKTIEFRQHSGTTEFDKIKNWIDFLSAFLAWTLKHEERLAASCVDDLPFLNSRQKKFYNDRVNHFRTIEENA